MQTNQEAKEIIKEREGLRLTAYQDTGGVWTIGYGTTAMAGVGITPKRGMKITQAEAERYLDLYLKKVEAQVFALVNVPLNVNQFSALVSFVYNLGPTQVRGSTLLRKLNAGDYKGASNEFGRWVYDNGVKLEGLVTRRRMEKALFDKPLSSTSTPAAGGLVALLLDFLKSLRK